MPGFNITTNKPGGKQGETVTSGGNKTSDPNNTYETARKHRWEVSINPNPNVMSGIAQQSGYHNINRKDLQLINFFAKSVTLPDISFDEIIIHNGQDKIFRPGKRTSKPVDITFYEVLSKEGKSIVQRLRAFLPNSINSSYMNPLLPDQLYIPEVNIYKLTGNGTARSQYNLYNCYIEKLSETDLDYTGSEICEITVTLKYNRYNQMALN